MNVADWACCAVTPVRAVPANQVTNTAPTGANNSYTIDNTVPTFTTLSSPVDTTTEDTEVQITFAELQAAGNEADTGGTGVNAFVVQAVSTGTLNIGATSGTATAFAVGTNDVIDSANHAFWTPALNANGAALSAFTVVARDAAGNVSASPLQVASDVTAVNDPPVASASSVTTTEGVAFTFAVANFGFTDVEGNPLASITVSNLSLAAGDTLTVDQGAGPWR